MQALNTSPSVDVAVVVPVYNRAKTVLQTLESVVQQSQPPGQLVVVDDGSTDATLASLEAWRARTSASFPIQIVAAEHRGAAAARNQGLRATGGARYVAFLDSDDLWPADFLERTRSALATHPTAVAVSCDQRRVHLDRGEVRPRSLRKLAENATAWIFERDAALASASLFRAEIVHRCGGWPEAIPTGHDLHLFLRVSLEGSWLHAEGAPVTMVRGSAERAGEQPNLSRYHAQKFPIWAGILESFATEGPGRQVLEPQQVRQVLAQRWRRAGSQSMRLGRVAEARVCYRRSCRWRTWNRAWLRLAESYLRPTRRRAPAAPGDLSPPSSS